MILKKDILQDMIKVNLLSLHPKLGDEKFLAQGFIGIECDWEDFHEK